MGKKTLPPFNGILIPFLSLFLLFLSPAHAILAETQTAGHSLSSATTAPATYGPVRTNEGLWEIAEKLRSHIPGSIPDRADTEITKSQIAVALFENNPEAFINQNMNGLRVGSTLKIPDSQQLQKRTQEDAFSLFLQHWEIWKKIESGEINIDEQISYHEPDKKALHFKSSQKTGLKTESKTTLEAKLKPKIMQAPKAEIVENKTSIKPLETLTPNIQLKPNANNTVSPTHTRSRNQLEIIYQKSHHSIIGAINWLQSHLNLSFFNDNFLSEQKSRLYLLIATLSLFFFIFLRWLFKHEETELIEIQTSSPDTKVPLISDKNTSLKRDYSDSIIDTKSDNLITATISPRNGLLQSLEQEDDEEADIFSGNIIPNDIDAITDWENTLQKTKIKHKRKNILEAAFEGNIFSTHNEVIPETIAQKSNPKLNDSTETNSFDSIDEIRFINENTKSSKIDAFFNATQTDILSDEILSHDFEQIKDNDKIDIFIQEFEDIMSTLSNHTPQANHRDKELKNLLQFKSSIHFIKILSEMMQATYLKQFSTTIIEFLEDVLDGKTKLTTDVTNRLTIVVSLYSSYIYSVKKYNNGKLEA